MEYRDFTLGDHGDENDFTTKPIYVWLCRWVHPSHSLVPTLIRNVVLLHWSAFALRPETFDL